MNFVGPFPPHLSESGHIFFSSSHWEHFNRNEQYPILSSFALHKFCTLEIQICSHLRSGNEPTGTIVNNVSAVGIEHVNSNS